MAAVGAFYLLTKRHEAYGKTFVKSGVLVGTVAALLQLFPTGDAQGKLIADHQPVTLAAMEGLFETQDGAPLVIIGQPDVQKRQLDNPIEIPSMLSFLTYRRWTARVRGLDAFPLDQWPDTIALLYYSYHVMVGLGTIFIAVMLLAALLLWRGKLYESDAMLWVLMLCVPLPYIANTAGWMTAELGRQPWLIYGLMRTAHGVSPKVGVGNAWFTLIGFMGLYTVLGILWLFLVYREIEDGPDSEEVMHSEPAIARPPAEERNMGTLWFCLIAMMIIVYVLLDGFDLGAGAIHLMVAKTDEERRQVLASIGPVWDGNEVWLVAAGGTLFFGFLRSTPVALADSICRS